MSSYSFLLFFFNDTATTEIYTLSLHDALPISGAAVPQFDGGGYDPGAARGRGGDCCGPARRGARAFHRADPQSRSEEHTSELQSQSNLVCRLLLEKKKKIKKINISSYTIQPYT